MKALVTGATGFVGSSVVRVLLQEDYSVRVLVRRSSNLKNLDGLPVERVLGDLRDYESLKRALRGCECLFHVAADYRLWVPRPEEIYRSNVEGTRNVMLAAMENGVEHFLRIWTADVLKQLDDHRWCKRVCNFNTDWYGWQGRAMG